jgi:hypothetical protein
MSCGMLVLTHFWRAGRVNALDIQGVYTPRSQTESLPGRYGPCNLVRARYRVEGVLPSGTLHPAERAPIANPQRG